MKIVKKECSYGPCKNTFYDFTKSETRKYCCKRCKDLEMMRLRRLRK
jgi:endogenous inhibitor of DNA gyrase (YacG/DUF329 family)